MNCVCILVTAGVAIMEPVDIQDIIANIKKKYLNISTRYKNQCPCHFRNVATLQLVASEIRGDIQYSRREGKITATVGKQDHPTYRNLFMRQHDCDEEKLDRKVLIVGEAGVGKTIVSTSIAEDWASGNLFQEFLILLYLPLCQRKVASAMSLLELFNELYGFSRETSSYVVDYLERNSDNVLIVADGWDELHKSECQKESFFHRLLFGDILPTSSIMTVLTSRPDSVPLHTIQLIDQFVTIRGLGKKTIESCLCLEFSGDTERSMYIIEQLESNPLAESMCRVPLNLAMICNFYQFCKEPLPNTMTEMYAKIIWYLAKVSVEHTDACKNILSLLCYHDLPKELQCLWWYLCMLAFKNIEYCHTGLSKSETTSFLSSELQKISRFGLVKSVSETGDRIHFNFLHPTIEEYLAALHLTRQYPIVQFNFIKLCARMNHVNIIFWRFFFGNCVGKVLDTDNIVQAVQMLSKWHHSCNDEYLLSHYSFEANNETVNCEVVKALITKKSSTSMTLHFGHSPNTHGCVNTHDCVAMIYVIEKIMQQCSMEINFQDCNLKTMQILKLKQALGSRSNKVQVKGLNLSDNRLDNSAVVGFFGAASALLALEKLFLRNCGIEIEGIIAIMDVLNKSSSHRLTQLDLSFNPISMSCLQILQGHINHGTLAKLETLFLKGSLTKDVSISCLASFVGTLSSCCLCLQLLDLSANNLGKPGNLTLSKIISQLTGLRRDFDLRLNAEYMSEVDDNFISIMEESIGRKGTIDYTIAHGVIVGPGRSGKNTLMSRLMGEKPPDPDYKSPSTGVLESVVKVEVKKLSTVAAAVSNLKWQRLEYDEEALELMMTTAKHYSVSSTISKPMTVKYIVVEQQGSTATTEESSPASGTDILNPNLTTSIAVKLDPESSNTTYHDSMSSIKETNVFVYSPHVAPVDIFKKALKLRRMDALREHLESSWSLYLTNTGGQIEFQEHLPLLVCGPSLFFVTFPLHHDLMKPYDVQYDYPDVEMKPYQSPGTLMDELLQTLATISALDCTGSQQHSNVESNIQIKPKIFFIGTYKDHLLESTAEKIQNIDKQIQKYVRQTSLFRQGSIQFAQPSEQLIFTVNNLSKEDGDFQKIRSVVQQTVERNHFKEFTVRCPSSWLIFSLILREKHKSSQVLSLDECFSIGRECGISDYRELIKALSFIHSRLGLVRYFNVEELNTLVVVDPQILFDKISDLIVRTFTGDHAEVNEIEDFREKGILPVAVMERISEKCSSDLQLPFTWLTKLLNYLRIAAFFTDHDGDKYFFPSVLCHVPKPHSIQVRSDSPPPILVAFKSGFCPRGIPGALIKCLMTNEIKSKWHWELLPNKIFRNQVSFAIKAYGNVTLKILPTHLEINLGFEADTTESESKVTCEEAYIQINEGMKIVTQYNKCGYYFGFYCTLDECKAHPHPAKIEWRGNNPAKLKCEVAHGRRGGLPRGYEIWNIQKKQRKGIIMQFVHYTKYVT